MPNADYILPIEIDGTVHNVYVLKRPYVDEFLTAVGKLYEVVLFTASLPKVLLPACIHPGRCDCSHDHAVCSTLAPCRTSWIRPASCSTVCFASTACSTRAPTLRYGCLCPPSLSSALTPFFRQDLSRLGRDVNTSIIVDNAPPSYMFHPRNAVPILSWFDDPNDTALRDLIPAFERLATASDIYPVLAAF